jgi:hypothetical protein
LPKNSQFFTFQWVLRASNGDMLWKILVVGSMSCGPSMGLSHEWLVKFIEHRIADRRVVRLIQKWLNAGVLEDGKRIRVEEGTPQGGSASPLLANVYLLRF